MSRLAAPSRARAYFARSAVLETVFPTDDKSLPAPAMVLQPVSAMAAARRPSVTIVFTGIFLIDKPGARLDRDAPVSSVTHDRCERRLCHQACRNVRRASGQGIASGYLQSIQGTPWEIVMAKYTEATVTSPRSCLDAS